MHAVVTDAVVTGTVVTDAVVTGTVVTGTAPVQRFEVTLVTGETAMVDGADAYQPEGPLTTFFTTGSSRQTIDSWSVRLASFRTADIVSVRRVLDLRSGPARLAVVA